MDNSSRQASRPAQPRTAAAERPASSRKAAPLIFILCLVVAISAVLFVPILVGGATAVSAASSAAATVPQPQAEQTYSSLADAAAALGFAPLVPQQLPKGYSVSEIRTLSGGILELEYASGRNLILFRTAPGADDLSGDPTEYMYTATEDANGIPRSYSGASQQKLNLAVWAQGDASYSIMAPGGIGNSEMHALAESIGQAH